MDRLQRGNLVRVIKGHSITHVKSGVVSEDEIPFDSERLAVIDHSFGEKYGDGSNTGDYSIIWLDSGGSAAWFQPYQLELVDIGGEPLIEEAKRKREEVKQRDTNMSYIKHNWNKLMNDGFSSDTMLFLFHKIGFTSSFERNGEYFVLFHDWNYLLPLYDFLFTKTDKDKLSKIQSDFKDSIVRLFDEIQSVK